MRAAEIDLQAAVDLRRHAHQAEQAVAAEGIQRYFYDRFPTTGLEGKFDTVILNGAESPRQRTRQWDR